ncbi:MAG: hypothetical protein HQL68_11605 [Magnetococcales bacterium]|nr:hypothetical protein [Magnetococcales bacterium]
MASGNYTGQSETTETQESQFNTEWLTPTDTIHLLDEHNYIQRNFMDVHLGSLVLAKGQIQILDIRMLRDLWPAVFKMFGNEIFKGQKLSNQDKNLQKNMIPQILAGLHHALQFSFSDGTNSSWGTLSPDHLIPNPGDIALKHGANIAGIWSVLAIVDATPSYSNNTFPDVEIGEQSILAAMPPLLDMVRGLMGRPDAAFGVTPLAIFRTITPTV